MKNLCKGNKNIRKIQPPAQCYNKQRIKSADNALHAPRHNDDGAYAKTQPDRHVCNKNS